MEPHPDEHVHPGNEDIKWGPHVTDIESLKDKIPSAKYNKLSEQARKIVTTKKQCSIFCGGKKCKYCTPNNWKEEQMVIKGLYSEWVTDNILAMARPSNYGFDNLHFIEQFQQLSISTVFNLQEPGEHVSCGYGLDSSGFSYNPQRLMDKSIYYYNFGWPDYDVPRLSTLVDIVKIMQFSVSQGKVAVHCHAGLGRTGLLIACYLVYNNRLKAGEAVHYVRSRRPGAIQTSEQVQMVSVFENFLKPFRTIFPSKLTGAEEVSFQLSLKRQRYMIHGYEERKLKHIPKVVYMCCERLLELSGKGQSLYRTRLFSSSTSVLSLNTHGSQLSLGLAESDQQTRMLTHSGSQPGISSTLSFEDITSGELKKIQDGENKDQVQNVSESLGSTETDSNHTKFTHIESATRDVENSMQPGNISTVNSANKGRKQYGNSLVSVREEKSNSVGAIDPKGTIEIGATSDGPIGNVKDASEVKGNGIMSVVEMVPGETASANSGCSMAESVEATDSDQVMSDATSSGSKYLTEVRGKRKLKKKAFGERFKTYTKKIEEIRNGKDNIELEGEEVRKVLKDQSSETHHPEASETSIGIDESGVTPLPGSQEASLIVCAALVETEYLPDVRKKADYIEIQLNETDSAWTLIADEENPHVLSTVLWDWLNQLKEPVLRRQDLAYLLECSQSPRKNLSHLERSVKDFIEYLARVMSKLFPQPADLSNCLIEHLVSHLTHSAVRPRADPLVNSRDESAQPGHWKEMRSSDSQKLVKFFIKLIEEVAKSK